MSQRFTPYGQLLVRDSAVVAMPKGLHVGWTGRETDPETGLTFHRARYHSPELRRWTQEDPIGYGGGGNLYAYVGGAVLTGRDPSGLIEDLRGGGGLGLAESFRPFTLDPTASSMLDQIPLPDGGAAARKAERENRGAQQGPQSVRQRLSECLQNPVCHDQLDNVSARVQVDLVPSTAGCKDPSGPCSELSADGLKYTIRFDPSEGGMTAYGLRAGGLPVDGGTLLTHELAHYWQDPTGARDSESLAVGAENQARAWYGGHYGQRAQHEQSLWFPSIPY